MPTAVSLCARGVLLLFFASTAGCDRERERLEQDLRGANLKIAELERASKAVSERPPDELARWIAAVDRRLPDAPRGAFTASIAAMLRDVAGAEVDGSKPTETRGQVITDPAIITVPAGELKPLFARMKNFARPWQLDALERLDERFVRFEAHSYVFAGAPSADWLTDTIEVAPDESSWFSGDRDALRAEIRAALTRADELLDKIRARGLPLDVLVAHRRAETKESILGEVERKSERARADAELLLEVFDEVDALPRRVSFAERMGRRLCTIAFETEADKTRIVAAASARHRLAYDARGREFVLPSGRVCTLSIGDPAVSDAGTSR